MIIRCDQQIYSNSEEIWEKMKIYYHRLQIWLGEVYGELGQIQDNRERRKGLNNLELLAQSLSHVEFFATPWTLACQAPLSMEFSRQEYWNGLPFPSPGAFPDPGIKPVSPVSLALASVFFTPAPPRKPPYQAAHL